MELCGQKYIAHYSHSSVDDEVSKYKFSVSGYKGTAGDSLAWHGGMKLSTLDQDNDSSSESCSQRYHGAWWYCACRFSSLNGEWDISDLGGVIWVGIKNLASLSVLEMKIRVK